MCVDIISLDTLLYSAILGRKTTKKPQSMKLQENINC